MVAFRNVNEVGAAVIIAVLVFPGSAHANDGVHLILVGAVAEPSTSSTTGVGLVDNSIGDSVVLLASPGHNSAVSVATDVFAEVISTSDAGGAVEALEVGNGSLLVLGEDA